MDAAHEVAVIVARQQRGVDNPAAGGGSVDELAVAHVDAGVGAGLAGVAAGIVEEDQVAGLQSADAVYPGALAALPLAGGGVGQADAELAVDIHGEAGAVKALGRGAAVNVADAKVLLGQSHDGRAGGAARAVLEMAGVKAIRTKCLRSNNKRNVVSATIAGLANSSTPDRVAKLRGKTVEEILLKYNHLYILLDL